MMTQSTEPVSSTTLPSSVFLTTQSTASSQSTPLSDLIMIQAKNALHDFYSIHSHVDPSHGAPHALRVLQHAEFALAETHEAIKSNVNVTLAIRLAALLHDVDDHKYFPSSSSRPGPDSSDTCPSFCPESYHNARTIMTSLATAMTTEERPSFVVTTIIHEIQELVITMIDLVSCSKYGNSVPLYIVEEGLYHYLIPRWSDRLEAVGIIGVIRCYQYNMAKNQPLFSSISPRATNAEEIWRYAVPAMLDAYISRGGTSNDMISHYYDKLLHIARPPKELVQNRYLEQQAELGVAPLIEVCIRFGLTGRVDEEYLRSLETQIKERVSLKLT